MLDRAVYSPLDAHNTKSNIYIYIYFFHPLKLYLERLEISVKDNVGALLGDSSD